MSLCESGVVVSKELDADVYVYMRLCTPHRQPHHQHLGGLNSGRLRKQRLFDLSQGRERKRRRRHQEEEHEHHHHQGEEEEQQQQHFGRTRRRLDRETSHCSSYLSNNEGGAGVESPPPPNDGDKNKARNTCLANILPSLTPIITHTHPAHSRVGKFPRARTENFSN